jgi:hypothetical protein
MLQRAASSGTNKLEDVLLMLTYAHACGRMLQQTYAAAYVCLTYA